MRRCPALLGRPAHRLAAVAMLLPFVAPRPGVPATLPACPAESAPSTRAPAAPPPAPGSSSDACRAHATRVLPGPAPAGPAASGPAEDATGYHHLGAVTNTGYAGVAGTFTVTDPAVRSGTNDFLSARFMALGNADGRARWLEAGWAENGWLRDDTQHLYTYNTEQMRWSYYDQYAIVPGDRVYLMLQSAGSSNGLTTWRAWLWWGNRWNLLTGQALPIPPRTTIEQYVESYADPARGGSFAVPAVDVSGVSVQDTPGGRFTAWRGSAVATTESPPYPGYCVGWRARWDDWAAGTC